MKEKNKLIMGRLRLIIPTFLSPKILITWGIYQQTVIDTYSIIEFAKLYDRKNALVAADMFNDRAIPFFEQHNLKLIRMHTDRGTEY